MNIDNQKIIDLYNKLSLKKEGEIITHEEIESIIKLTRESKAYISVVKKVREFLIAKNSIFLKSIRGIGYQVMFQKHVANYTYRTQIKKAVNSFNYSEFMLNNVKENELTNERKEQLELAKKLNEDLKEIASKTLKQSTYYSREAYYNSLDKMEQVEER